MQSDLLSARRQGDLRLYAVWFNMYPGDARTKWSSELLGDSRVTQYWDEPRIVGQTYLAQLPTILERRAPQTMPPVDDALWDAFFVYAPDARWQDRPPMPVTWGYPIMVNRDTLASEVDRILRR